MDADATMDDINDVDTTVTIKLGNNSLRLAQDPAHHGFWFLSLEKGQLPTEFRGRYTKKVEAEKAASRYIAGRTTNKE